MYPHLNVSVFLLCFFALTPTLTYGLDEVQYEKSYLKISNQINFSGHVNFTRKDTHSGKILMDVLWDKYSQEIWTDKFELKEVLSNLPSHMLSSEDKFRLYLLKNRLGLVQLEDQDLLNRFYKRLVSGQATRRGAGLYYRYGSEVFKQVDVKMLNRLYPNVVKNIEVTHDSFRPKTKAELQDLVFRTPVSESYKNGKYLNKPQLFMFCRHNRRYHCLMIMKDSNGELVRNTDGEIWSQHKLGLARRSVPYNERNGYTPSGVYTIDSVMPYADQQKTYGEFRRLIMNFIDPSEDESILKEFLPYSAHDKNWWKEGVVARDIGRNLLRIHGTGRKNWNPFSRHYPFVKTSGCIMSREGEYGDYRFIDQRRLLDQMMRASDLFPIYDNETEIEGLLYLIEVSDENEHIYLPEIEWYLGLR